VSKVNKKRMDLFTMPRGRARDALARGDGVPPQVMAEVRSRNDIDTIRWKSRNVPRSITTLNLEPQLPLRIVANFI